LSVIIPYTEAVFKIHLRTHNGTLWHTIPKKMMMLVL